jgi:carboxylesterase type B
MIEMAHAANRASSPAYLYLFAHHPPYAALVRGMPVGAGRRALGAHHASEIAYVFGTPAAGNDPAASKESQFSELVQGYWVRFAATGNPNGGASPVWPAFDNRNRHFMAFDSGAVAGSDLLSGGWELHNEIDRRRNRAGLANDGANPGMLGRTEPASPVATSQTGAAASHR